MSINVGSSYDDIFQDNEDAASDCEEEVHDAQVGLERLRLKVKEDESSQRPQRQPTPQLPLPELNGNRRTKPLTLVDLPVDVLREIVKEVTHTNDLTNLCLTCRCLHSLAVPQIYSRFDIVWPDAASTGDRVGVDALTHGLATLTNVTKRGNDHARWVKKFSLGNGPTEWVNEYNINKEGGKMLGTLVNLAITRMLCLETFSWDMPTGILRDVFMSLHDLNGTLKNVHVRFHNNSNSEPGAPSIQDSNRKVETPTFKGFKGLRSLSVLDIDERQYLEEMSFAVESSVDRLRELRIGIAQHTGLHRQWIRDWDNLENTSPTGSQDGIVGGVLGIVVSRIVDLEEGRKKRKGDRPEDFISTPSVGEIANVAVETAEAVVMTSAAPAAVYVHGSDAGTTPTGHPPNSAGTGEMDIENNEPTATVSPSTADTPAFTPENSVLIEASASQDTAESSGAPVEQDPPTATPKPSTVENSKPYDDLIHPKQLKLETFALERVPISVSILVHTRAVDWTVLQNLTILNCHNHERLWKALRRRFSPFTAQQSTSSLSGSASQLKHGQLQPAVHTRPSRLPHQPAPSPSDYKIRLKKLHTDCVTPHLVAFIRDALPPNSLEILFLQEVTAASTVLMESIYKSAIRRHRSSLRKLLIDSKQDEVDDFHKWTFSKEHLTFVSSGKMPNLRELGMTLEYKDWHYFLTRLPHMPQLRSLYITHVRGQTSQMPQLAPLELANQILNTVILRPEVELCYAGILDKCFEILEGPCDDSDIPSSSQPLASGPTPAGVPEDSEDEEESDVEDEDEDEDDLGYDDDPAGEDTDSEGGFGDEDNKKPGIRLREILFYDDKVEIFRARNARL